MGVAHRKGAIKGGKVLEIEVDNRAIPEDRRDRTVPCNTLLKPRKNKIIVIIASRELIHVASILSPELGFVCRAPSTLLVGDSRKNVDSRMTGLGDGLYRDGARHTSNGDSRR